MEILKKETNDFLFALGKERIKKDIALPANYKPSEIEIRKKGVEALKRGLLGFFDMAGKVSLDKVIKLSKSYRLSYSNEQIKEVLSELEGKVMEYGTESELKFQKISSPAIKDTYWFVASRSIYVGDSFTTI